MFVNVTIKRGNMVYEGRHFFRIHTMIFCEIQHKCLFIRKLHRVYLEANPCRVTWWLRI